MRQTLFPPGTALLWYRIVVYVLLSTFALRAQLPAPLLSIARERNATNLILNVAWQKPTNAIVALTEVFGNLASINPKISNSLAVVTNAVSFDWTLKPNGTQSFFTAQLVPFVSLDEIDTTENENFRAAVDSLTCIAWGEAALISGQPYSLRVEILNGVGQRTPLNGDLRFEVFQDELNTTPVPDVTFQPTQSRIISGIFEGSITFRQSNEIISPAYLTVRVVNISVASKNEDQLPLLKSTQELTAKVITKQICDVAADTGWLHPLGSGGSRHGLTGTFGEWPGHFEQHWGVDLKADANTPVYASRSGTVSYTTAHDPIPNAKPNVGGMLAIEHGGVYSSQYLHMEPLGMLRKGDCVRQGQQIGIVRKFPDVKLHLHFGTSILGVPVNPTDVVPSLVDGDTSPPEVSSILVRTRNLGAIPPGNRANPLPTTRGETTYVGIQVVDRDPRSPGNVLAPRSVTFTAKDSTPLTYSMVDKESVKAGFHNPDRHGYSVLNNGEEIKRSLRYQFWFPWSLPQLDGDYSGPAEFEVAAKDAAGNSSTRRFTFGPRFSNRDEFRRRITDFYEDVYFPIKFECGPFPENQNPDVPEAEIELFFLPSRGLGTGEQYVVKTVSVRAGESINVPLRMVNWDCPGTIHTNEYRLACRAKEYPSLGDTIRFSIIFDARNWPPQPGECQPASLEK